MSAPLTLPDIKIIKEDQSDNSWPFGWQADFGRYEFFFLEGFGDFFWRQECAGGRGIRQNLVANGLTVGKTVTGLDAVPSSWLKTYPGQQELSDEAYNPSAWYLDKFSKGRLDRLIGNKAVNFATAMLVLPTLLRLSGDDNHRVNFKIRLASCYITGLHDLVAGLTRSERERLNARMGGPNIGETIDDLLVGYPVTKSFAEKLILNLMDFDTVNEADIEDLEVHTYTSREHLRESVVKISDSSSIEDTMRVAGNRKKRK